MDDILRIPTKPVGELTWIAGGEVDESSVSLRFFGDDLDPDIMTTIMAVCPTISYRKGDIFRGKTYDKIQKTGSWRYRTQRSGGISLEEQMNNLFNLLPADLEVWRELKKVRSQSILRFMAKRMESKPRSFIRNIDEDCRKRVENRIRYLF